MIYAAEQPYTCGHLSQGGQGVDGDWWRGGGGCSVAIVDDVLPHEHGWQSLGVCDVKGCLVLCAACERQTNIAGLSPQPR